MRKNAVKHLLWMGIGINLLLAIVKAYAGIKGNSEALFADAIESSSDVFSSFLVYLGLRYASRPPDENHPYGHGKAEPLFTFVVVAFLLFSAGYIMVDGYQQLSQPQEVPSAFTLYVALGVIAIKELVYRLMKKRASLSGSPLLMAEAWHHRADAITSCITVLGIGATLFFGPAFIHADDYAALAAGAIILFNAYKIFRPALGEVMDEHRYDDLVEIVRLEAAKVPGVKGTEKCLVRKMGTQFHVDLHLEVDGEISVSEGHRIAHEVKDQVCNTEPRILDMQIHVEPVGN